MNDFKKRLMVVFVGCILLNTYQFNSETVVQVPISPVYTGEMKSSPILIEKKEETEQLIEFVEADQPATLIQTAWLKNSYEDNAQDVCKVLKYATVVITGYSTTDIYRVQYEGKTYYIDKNYLTTSQDTLLEMHKATYNNTWTRSVLCKKRGAIQGPNGRETYYNLDMTGVLKIMNDLGYEGTYWVREDGVKMFGDYIMCAADLNIHPRGSLVESTLGMCMVCDTGAFAIEGNTKLDIAVNW